MTYLKIHDFVALTQNEGAHQQLVVQQGQRTEIPLSDDMIKLSIVALPQGMDFANVSSKIGFLNLSQDVMALRQGVDLVLYYGDGTEVVIKGFFAPQTHNLVEVVLPFSGSEGEDVLTLTPSLEGHAFSDGFALIALRGDSAVLLDMAKSHGDVLSYMGALFDGDIALADGSLTLFDAREGGGGSTHDTDAGAAATVTDGAAATVTAGAAAAGSLPLVLGAVVIVAAASGGGSSSSSDTIAPTVSADTPPVTEVTGGGNSIGDTIVLTITFSENVSGLTSGDNASIFTVDGSGVTASWSGEDGTDTRKLTYTVLLGQNGQAAIDEAALKTALLAANITDNAGNALAIDSDIANIDETPLPVVDGTPASAKLSTSNRKLKLNEKATITIDLSDPVSDFAEEDITVVGGELSAFTKVTDTQYTVDFTLTDATNGGLFRINNNKFSDAAGNFNSDGSEPDNSIVFGVGPSISSSVTDLVEGGNSIGDTITLTITFSANVNGLTSGDNPGIFTIDGEGVEASWSGTDGTNTRTLTYTVKAGQNGQAAINEIALKNALLAAGIKDGLDDALLVPGTIANIDETSLPVIDGTPPTLSVSTLPAHELTDGGDGLGDKIILTITFSEAVNGLTDGSDASIFTVDGTGVEAVWSGTDGEATRKLTYTVQSGQNGQAAIDEAALRIALVADIADVAGNALVIDSDIANIDKTPLPVVHTPPGLSSSTLPATEATNGGDSIGDTIFLTVTFSEAVNGLTSGNDSTIFMVDDKAVEAVWSGKDGETTRILTYTVKAGDNGQATIDEAALKTALLAAGIKNVVGEQLVISGDIADIDAGEEALPVVDGTPPTLSIHELDGVYVTSAPFIGATFNLLIHFSENINGLADSSDDTIFTDNTIFTVDGVGVEAVWSGNNDDNVRTLTYTVQAGQNGQVAIDKIALKNALLAGNITDGAGNALVIEGDIADIKTHPSGTSLPVIDGTAPTLLSTPVTEMTDGGDSVGDTISLTVTFSENVNGLTGGSDSTIFTVGGAGVEAVWSGTDGETTRKLTYTIQAGQDGQVAIDEDALKTALIAGIKDSVGNTFEYSGNIENIDSTPLPIVDTPPTLSASTPPVTGMTGGGNSVGDTIFLTVTFSEAVNGLTSGSDDTIFTFADAGVEAVWSGTDGETTRILTYVVQAGDYGWASIDEAALKTALLDAGITDSAGKALVISGNIADIDTGANVLPFVETPATLSRWVLPVTDMTGDGDSVGDVITLTVTFNRAVNGLTGGNDSTIFKVADAGVEAVWSGTNGETTRILTYTVKAGDNGQATIDEAALKTALLAAGITDGALNALEITGDIADIDTGANALPVIDTPLMLSATPVAEMTNGGDSVGDTIALTITFSEAVNGLTGGDDSTIFTVGGTNVTAVWSGTGGETTRILTYTIQAGQNGQASIDEVALKTALVAGITDGAGNAFEHSGDIENIDATPLPIVDTTGPSISTVAISSNAGGDDTYILGEVIEVTLTFDEAVIVDITGGTPQLALDIGGETRQAVYSSGSGGNALVFSYTVVAGDADSDGIAVSANALLLNGGSIRDGAGNDAVLTHTEIATAASHMVDGVAPVLSASTPPATEMTGGGDSVGDTIVLTITFSEAVNGLTGGNDSTIFTVDGAGVEAVWSGTDGTNTRILTYTVQAGQNGQASIDEAALKTALVAGITDGAGNALVISGDIADIDVGEEALPVVDTTIPTLSSTPVVETTGGGNSVGDTIALTITFSEAVNGLTGGSDRTVFELSNADGTANVEAVWSGTNGTNTRTLTYTVQAGESGRATIDEAALTTALLAGNITDVAGNAFALSGAIADIDVTPLPIVDGNVPSVSAVFISSSGVYMAGDVINVAAIFTGTITIDTTGGTPTLELQIGGNARQASYVSTLGSGTLEFSYTVQDGDTDNDGISILANALALNGGSIQDAAGNNAILTHEGVAASASHTVDTTAPTLSGAPTTEVTNSGDSIGDTIALTLTFSENVNGLTGGSDSTIFTVGGAGVEAVWSGTDGETTRTLTYTIQAGDNGQAAIDEAALRTALLAAGVTDGAGNALVISDAIADIDATPLPVVDGTGPTLSGTPTTELVNGGDNVGDTIILTVNFSEAVNGLTIGDQSGVFKIGGTNVTAVWSGTDGETTRTLTYTIKTGDNGQAAIDEIALRTALLAAGVTDGAGNALVISDAIADIDATPLPTIDGTVPSVSGIAVSSDAGLDNTYMAGDVIQITVSFSKNVTVDTTGGTPALSVQVGSNTRQANYDSGSSSNALVFSYTVQAGDADSDGISISTNPLSLNGGSITDSMGNDAVLTHGGVAASVLHMVDGVAPSISTIVVSSDAGLDNIYKAGDIIELTVSFSENVTVDTTGGTPALGVQIGSNTRQANYDSGSSSNALVFKYTVQAGDTDANGIAVSANALLLNGGSIQDAVGNDAVLTHGGVAASASHIVDTTDPSISTVAISSNAGSDNTYGIGDVIQLTVTFNENVTVDTTGGTPALGVQIGSNTRQAVYSSGSGSNALVFSYTVVADDADSDGIAVSANVLLLNGGSITDVAGNDAVLTHTEVTTAASHMVEGVAPTLSGTPTTEVTGDGDNIGIGDTITLTVTFSENVNGLTSGNNAGIFTLVGASVTSVWSGTDDTSTRTLTYTVQEGQNGRIGINESALRNALLAGNITDMAGNALSIPDAIDNVDAINLPVVDTTDPSISTFAFSSNAGSDNVYIVGDVIQLRVAFNENVTVDTTGGTPAISVQIGSNTRQATYVSGSGSNGLLFDYTVQAGDVDNDGIAVLANALLLNGGSIRDGAGNDAVLTHTEITTAASHMVDGVVPVLSVSTPPATEMTGGGDSVGDTIFLTITFSEAVNGLTSGNDSTVFTVGGTNVATVWSGTDGETTRILTYTIQAGDNGQAAIDEVALRTVLLAAGITDGAGNALVISDAIADIDATPLPNIDTMGPSISTVTISSNAGLDNTYRVGDVIQLTVSFSENVTVVTTGGTPALGVQIGSNTRQAVYSSGSGSNALVFSYTVVTDDVDSDGIAVSANALSLNGGSIRDGVDTDAVLTHTEITAAASHMVDGVAPTLSASTPPVGDMTNGGDSVGDTIFITVTFSEAVNGLTSGSNNTIFTVGGTDVTAVWSGANGETTRILTYTVQAGQNGQALINEAALRTALLAANITDIAGNALEISGNIENIDATPLPSIDTAGPSISTVTISSDAGPDDIYIVGDVIQLTVSFSENVTVDTTGGTPALGVQIGNNPRQATYASGSGGNTLVFSYTVQAGDADNNGISISANAFSLNGGSITDGAGTDAVLTHTEITTAASHMVDGVAPTLLSTPMSGVTNGGDNVGDTIFITVIFSEAVNGLTGGSDNTIFTVGGTDVTAVWSGTDGQNTRQLTYTVQAGQNGQTVIDETALRTALLAASITDDAGNALSIPDAIADIDATALPVVDTTAPIFATGTTELTGGGNSIGDTIALTVTFSEAVNGLTGGSDSTIFTVGGAGVAAVWSGTDGTNTRTLTYTVQVGDSGQAAIDESALRTALLGANITDGAGNALSMPGVPSNIDSTPLPTIDSVAPTIFGVSPASGAGPDDTFMAGDVIELTVGFLEAVTVDTTGGTPTLGVQIGTNTRQATYSSGSGSNLLTFSYTVVTWDTDNDGIAILANSLLLNGGSIRDGAGNDAVLTHVELADSASHMVDGVAPTLAGTPTTGVTGGGDNAGDTIFFTVTFSEAVNGLTSGSDSTIFTVGSAGVVAVWSGTDGTNTRTLTYTVQTGQNGQAAIDETALRTALLAGNITDVAGNALEISGNIDNIDATALPVVDTTSPAETPALFLIASDSADILEGTDGIEDVFIWSSTSSSLKEDIVQNFNSADGDKLDISDMLKGYEKGLNINEWITLEQKDEDTRITIDVDGQGDGAIEQVILLANVSDYATVADMIADGALVVI